MRFLTLSDSIPNFNEYGLGVSRSWRDIDVAKLEPAARDMLELQVGRLVQVHPEDEEAFVATSSPLELFEGKFRYAPGTDLKTVEPIGKRHAAAAVPPVEPAIPQPDGPTLNAGAEAGDAPNADVTKPNPAGVTPAADALGDATPKGFVGKKGGSKS